MPKDEAAALMNDKEKNYVAYCFSRLASQRGASIDFGQVLAGEKIGYDLRAAKQETTVKFGKISRRSKKWMRPSANTEASFLEQRLLLSELFEMAAVMGCIILDEQNLAAIEDAIYRQFASSLSDVINNKRIFSFLTEFFRQCTPETKLKVLSLLVANSGAVSEIEGLVGFLRPEMPGIPDALESDLDHLWGCSAGYALGICLLEKTSLVEPIVMSFISSEVAVVDYFPEFLEKLASSGVSAEDARKIQNKLTSMDDAHAAGLACRLFPAH